MNWPGETVLSRLIETLEKGVGALVGPWQARRMGQANSQARAQEVLMLAQAEVHAQEIRSGRKVLDAAGTLISTPTQHSLLPEATQHSLKSGSFDHQDFQALFANAAASTQVASPGSYSLHTVDFLSRMSQSDVKLLERIAPFATHGGLLRAAQEVWESTGLSFPICSVWKTCDLSIMLQQVQVVQNTACK